MDVRVLWMRGILREGGLPMSSYEIDTKVKELRELHDLDAEVRAEIAAIEDLLKAEMTERGTDELSGQECAVRWKTILSSRFDSAAFKLSYADLFRQYSRATTSRRFLIT